MELTKEKQIEVLKKAGIEDIEKFLEGKKLLDANEFFLIYEDEGKNIECISIDYEVVLSVHGKGNLLVHGSVSTIVDGEGETYLNGKGAVYLHRFITIPSPKLVHEVAKSNGWYEGVSKDNKYFVPAQLALIHSEISEALEVYRKEEDINKNDHFVDELADVYLRLNDLVGFLGLDIEQAINQKHEYNKTRPYRHGNKFV